LPGAVRRERRRGSASGQRAGEGAQRRVLVAGGEARANSRSIAVASAPEGSSSSGSGIRSKSPAS
jgi:hypothetical protein